MAGIGWAVKRDRDGWDIPDCWLTRGGYTVARMRVDDLVAFSVTAPGSQVPMAYRTTRDEVVAVIEQHMAGGVVARFGVGAC